jgi:hypothetical protein
VNTRAMSAISWDGVISWIILSTSVPERTRRSVDMAVILNSDAMLDDMQVSENAGHWENRYLAVVVVFVKV